MKRLDNRAWKLTPYATSDAKTPDRDIEKLLEKYKVTEHQTTKCRGPNGRPSVMIRFNLRDKTYRIAVETLDAQAEDAELLRQAKRAVFWMLKSALEAATLFFTPEEALFAFLELPDQSTTFEAMRPHLYQLTAENMGRMMLPTKVRQLPSPQS